MSENRLFTLILVLLFSFTVGAAENSSEGPFHLDTTPNIDKWGLDLGFYNQPYMDSTSRIGVFSPFLFQSGYGDQWRLNFDFSVKNLQEYSNNGIVEYGLYLEADGKIYKDVVYSSVKFGLGTMTFDADIYEGSVNTFPITLGLHVVTRNTVKGSTSIFLDYRFYAATDYDKDKSLPDQSSVGIREEALFSSALTFGLRLIF
ncbi:MAG: hypothetical protein CL677_05400 [Bdellovibrionaceae bacterium]|nr:hypothetical protein [Pseudobdellovibrionaceae bacterium]|tara:strand:+ start:123548 stop:124153 length:606 start_codon:yes stop_codon:yes gene_type:complete